LSFTKTMKRVQREVKVESQFNDNENFRIGRNNNSSPNTNQTKVNLIGKLICLSARRYCENYSCELSTMNIFSPICLLTKALEKRNKLLLKNKDARY
jgi:hypothetical protein